MFLYVTTFCLFAAVQAFSAQSHQLIRQLPISSPFPQNGCSTSGSLGFPPIKCQGDLTCVLISFGFPAVDDPTVGTCEKTPEPLVPCSVQFCSSTPTENAICSVSGQVATCNAWATRRDGSTERPDCTFLCTQECRIPMLVASDGSTHCNQCILSAASCQANFTFYGPIETDKCDNPSIFEQAECCIEQQKGCVPIGERCSTAGSRIRPVPCEKEGVCVIDNFGFPAADRPNSGICKKIRRPNRIRNCSLGLCVWKGENRICQLRKSGIVTTCGAWSRRSDGGRKPRCKRRCPKSCIRPYSKRPKGSDRRRYCNLCFLIKKSCRSGFKLFRLKH